ncbi:hypothetical protein CC85DRAFT_328331 [Cutaneotrichosporon oleaginosum]|uniref:Zn(2)-C6 fungal-type domain-containing protein n=1 Tax=Cutaneotrichosporon oleaginosum TaxID=879819 RepID=A0A0J1B3P2_9TREE|nr:uncharacterized protein CC85DRAFT_328331 [Cutaneotrichosporon oleaginosum]KLT42269.1 hypothetical protein CC85DRAFT_328331 [Cutaneotrichosporon oleaginosum]TXT11441.1 hypothetical protein COLE_01851 [Cutaneotrichosporon oleaginosum]
MPRASASGEPPRHQRTYRACTACRAAKLRCDLGPVDAPEDLPCRRCRRTGRKCEFTESYQRKRSRTDSALSGSAAPASGSTPRARFDDAQPRYEERRTRPDDPPPRLDLVGGNLETPADALRLLSSVSAQQPATSEAALAHTYDPALEGEVWNRWSPVREGLLTSGEAGALVGFYARNINPCHPVVSVELFDDPSLLLQEPLLVGAITCTAARYADLGPSFDAREPSRARVVQARIVEWLLGRIARLVMGSSSMRTIGTVEALLILSEWPPRSMLVEDSVGDACPSSACKHQDDVAWTNVALAVRIAQEVGLHDETTYLPVNTSDWQTRRRVHVWIQCMSADQHIAGRLGRDSLISTKMATSWWDQFFLMSCERLDHRAQPIPRARPFWRQSRVNAEHAHVIAVCHQTLYPSPAVTADLIRTGRFQSFLDRLKPELDHLWTWATGGLDSDADGAVRSPDQRRSVDINRIFWRIDHDYVRLYANAIAMRAAVSRLLRGAPMPGQRTPGGERIMATTVIISVEGLQMIEAVDSAVALLEHGIECHRRGVLRFCPGRTFQRILFAAVFLMKALSHGAVAEKEPAVLDLQHQMLTCFREAAVDDEHIAAEIARLLEKVFPALPTLPPPTLPAMPLPADPELEQSSSFDLGVGLGSDAAPEEDVFANWGFDPVLILNEMDAFIQTMDR